MAQTDRHYVLLFLVFISCGLLAQPGEQQPLVPKKNEITDENITQTIKTNFARKRFTLAAQGCADDVSVRALQRYFLPTERTSMIDLFNSYKKRAAKQACCAAALLLPLVGSACALHAHFVEVCASDDNPGVNQSQCSLIEGSFHVAVMTTAGSFLWLGYAADKISNFRRAQKKLERAQANDLNIIQEV